MNPTLSGRGYTGHRHNNTGANDLGLIYMRARFYVPSIGRFASADTIVPEPKRPQSFNRYSYVYNNPLRYTDPTGHKTCDDMPWECNSDGTWFDDGTELSANNTLSTFCVLNTCEGEGIGFIAVVIQGEVVHLPYHIYPNYDDSSALFPWEAPADVLYAEHSSLHPSKYNNNPKWRERFEQTWQPEAIGILQTMTNRDLCGMVQSLVYILLEDNNEFRKQRINHKSESTIRLFPA